MHYDRGGKKFKKWDNVKKVNLAISGLPSQAVGEGNQADAALAIDGNPNSFSNSGKLENPRWKVQLQGGAFGFLTLSLAVFLVSSQSG